MKQKIKTHIISGFLGAGKTTYISKLLKIKPIHETWVVLVNESGVTHYAKQQLESNGVIVKELYGGCLCCIAGMPFRVALNNVIKKHNPQRLFIEPAGAGHLANIKSLLQGEFYHPVLTLENTLCLLANWQLNEAKYANNQNFLALIEEADKLCFYEQSAEIKTKKMAFEYSKPFSRLHYTVEDLS